MKTSVKTGVDGRRRQVENISVRRRPVENVSGRRLTVDVSGLTFSSRPYNSSETVPKLH